MSKAGKNLREMFEQRVNNQTNDAGGGSAAAPLGPPKGFWSFNVNTVLMIIVGMVVIGIITKLVFLNRDIQALETKIDLVRTSPEDLSSFVNRGIEERMGILQNLAKSTTPPCIPFGYGAPPQRAAQNSQGAPHDSQPQRPPQPQPQPPPQPPPHQPQPPPQQPQPPPQSSRPAPPQAHAIPDPPATENMENFDDVMRLAQRS